MLEYYFVKTQQLIESAAALQESPPLTAFTSVDLLPIAGT